MASAFDPKSTVPVVSAGRQLCNGAFSRASGFAVFRAWYVVLCRTANSRMSTERARSGPNRSLTMRRMALMGRLHARTLALLAATLIVIAADIAVAVVSFEPGVDYGLVALPTGTIVELEPGGAAAFAALHSGAWKPAPGQTIGVLLCGANTTAVKFD